MIKTSVMFFGSFGIHINAAIGISLQIYIRPNIIDGQCSTQFLLFNSILVILVTVVYLDCNSMQICHSLYEPRCEKTGLRSFQPGLTQTGCTATEDG